MTKTETLTLAKLNKSLNEYSHLTRIEWEDTARALHISPRVVENYIKGRGITVVTATAILSHLKSAYKKQLNQPA